MIIKTKLSERDYIYSSFVILLSKPVVKLVFIYLFACAAASAISAHFQNNSSSFLKTATIPAIIILTFGFIYLIAKRKYKEVERNSECIEYYIEKDYLVINGESFNSKLRWNNVYKVTKTKNWLLIWFDKQRANPI